MKNIHLITKHIYITNDEEIKKKDYFLSLNDDESYLEVTLNNEVDDFNDYADENWTDNCKKIILTTDQDLIAEGIQQIDDEFLAWFVKNPSCISVETSFACLEERQCMCKSNKNCLKIGYKIIIPKEETKCTCKEHDPYCCQIHGTCPTCVKQEELKTNLERLPFLELIKEFAEYYKKVPLVEKPKQENCCPKCGELENFHYNYDYSKVEKVHILDILCNECGELFPPILKLPKQKVMKTAMQELIDWATSLQYNQQQCIDWITIKNKAEQLLEKEKPKQECTCENPTDNTCGYCEKENKIEILEEAKKRALEKETLEEAAKEFVLSHDFSLLTNPNHLANRCFQYGAKWQQERMYTEEDMIKFAEFVASYPDKNRNYLNQTLHAKSKYDGSERTIDLFGIWFKQFKNK